MREELLEKNVVKLVRLPTTKAERHPLDVDETRAVLKATRDDRLHAMYAILALLGLRRSELLALQWQDVDLVGGTLQVRHGLHRVEGSLRFMPTKTARSRRTIRLPDALLTTLRRHLAQQERERSQLGDKRPDSGFVFSTPVGTPIDPDSCSKLVRAACKQAGVRTVRMHDSDTDLSRFCSASAFRRAP